MSSAVATTALAVTRPDGRCGGEPCGVGIRDRERRDTPIGGGDLLIQRRQHREQRLQLGGERGGERQGADALHDEVTFAARHAQAIAPY
jgi:hypothetical protein